MRSLRSFIAALMALVMLASSTASVWAKGAHVTPQAAAQHCSEHNNENSGSEAISANRANSTFDLTASAMPEGSTDLPQSSFDVSCCEAFCVSAFALLPNAPLPGQLLPVDRQKIASDKPTRFGDSVDPPPPRILAA